MYIYMHVCVCAYVCVCVCMYIYIPYIDDIYTFSRRAVAARCRRGRGMGGQDGLRADADAW